MDCLILNGNPKPSDFDDYLEGFAAELRRRKHAARRLDLRDLRLDPCVGCWSCWWKTPGHCARKDDMASLYPSMVAADLVVWASPLVLGTVSALLKTAQDRFVPLAHPYIEIVDGECHHRHRYVRNADIGLIVERDASDTDEDVAITRRLFERFGKNTRSRLRVVAEAHTMTSEEAAHAALVA